MNKKIKTVIFDLGGVLVDWNPEYVYRKIFKDNPEKVNWFLNTICTSEWNVAQDAGRSIEEANQIKIAEFPEHETLIRSYYEQWPQMFSGAIKGTLSIFEALKKSKNYRYYALTNWSAETWPTALELFPFLTTFQGVVVSGEEKTRKPFDAIYKILLERYQIQAESAVFIDDNYDNVVAARKFGIHGIHFNSPKQLDKELKALGIEY